MADQNRSSPTISDTVPPEDRGQVRVTDDLDLLLDVLPTRVRDALAGHPDRDELVEVVLDLGRPPEARFPDRGEFLEKGPEGADEGADGDLVSRGDLEHIVERVGRFGRDNRAGIERTLHRISALRNREGHTVGVTCRVGRAVQGTVDILRDVVEEGVSILLLGRPGVGKTTLLREAARVLADDLGKRVVVVDTSNEIAGDGDVPHPGIGRARRMQVPTSVEQADVMIEAVENHMPEVIVIDEIGTRDEAAAARTIAERGVQLIATAHGNTLENLLQNPTLSDLVGGIQVVTLSDEEARRRGTQKTVLERKAPPTFDVLVEIHSKESLAVHRRVAEVVDRFLRGMAPRPERRVRTDGGAVEISPPEEAAREREPARAAEAPEERPRRRRAADSRREDRGAGTLPPGRPRATAGRDLPQTPGRPGATGAGFDRGDRFADRPLAAAGAPEAAPEAALSRWPGSGVGEPPGVGGGVAPGRASRILRIFPYAVSRTRLERAIRKFKVPAYVVQDLSQADIILTTKSQERRQPRKLRDAQARGVPLHLVKSNTVTQMESFLQTAFDLEEEAGGGRGGEGNGEAAALQEAQEGVDRVYREGHPVELAPRNSYLRRLQHELVGRHRLTSESKGDEPYRRVVLYPA